jgi:hypothetical protein
MGSESILIRIQEGSPWRYDLGARVTQPWLKLRLPTIPRYAHDYRPGFPRSFAARDAGA